MSDEATMEAEDLRKLMQEVAKRMNSLWVVHRVRISFNIQQTGTSMDYRLTAFSATKVLVE